MKALATFGSLMALGVWGMVGTATAQHDHRAMQPPDTLPPAVRHPSSHMAAMSHGFSLSLPMNRNGSGTSWLPDATPLYALMHHSGPWMLMHHGSVFLRYTAQNFTHPGGWGQAARLSAPNWYMGMAQRRLGKNGLLLGRLMLSLDRLTEGGNGYPLLFQTGESWNGKPLINRQHPHDLFSEMAVGYTQRVGSKTDLSVYVGYPGEPALGPPAFMHRISAFSNPDATLGHHWQDATHITFGVATVGLRVGKFKLEGSGFTGREPDENRFNFDKPRFDSYSGRISFAPSAQWSLQVSRGFIKSPEALAPSENVTRSTASALYSRLLGQNAHFTAAAVWGYNASGGHHHEHSVLGEASLQQGRWGSYGRYEFVQKSARELNLLIENQAPDFNIHALTLGVNRQVAGSGKLLLAAGTQITFYALPLPLSKQTGNTPVSGQVYLRLTPQQLKIK